MKKQLLSILLLLSLLCCVACQNEATDTSSMSDNTNTTPKNTSNAPDNTSRTLPEENEPPTIFEPLPYVPYLNDISFKNDAIDHQIDSLIGSTIQLAPEVFPKTEDIKEVELNIPDVTWEWGEYCFTGTYQYTFIGQAGHKPYTKTRYYRVGERGQIGYDVESGKWVYLSLTSEKWLDADKTVEKLTLEECKEIALEYFQNYVETIGTDIDLDEYELDYIDRLQQTTPEVYCYCFYYRKPIIKAMDCIYTETISCWISERGSLVLFSRSESYDNFDESTLDYDTVYAKLNEIGKAVCNTCAEWDFSYSIGEKCHIFPRTDGSYLFRFFIDFQYTEQGTEKEYFMSFDLIT